LAVVVVVFFLIQIAPGDAALYLAGDQGVGDAEFLAQVRADYGLDRPLLVQLRTYVGNVAQLDLGDSIYFNEPVLGLIVERLFATVLLAGTSLLFAVGLGVAIGVYTARRPESSMSSAATVSSLVGFSTPVFYSAIMFIVLFAAKWSLLPVGGIEDVRYEGNWVGETIDLLQHLILPALSLGIIYLAIYSRLARASMLEVLESDYIRTARAKGARERVVVYKHALRNAVIPVVTAAGLQVGNLLSGALLVEVVFAWPGVGRLAVDSIFRRDSPTLLGIMIFSSAMVILANLLTDLVYRIIDPRIRVGGSR
jgi:peptide/nickel transport system permease protein|tara:strand:- start:1453 stop:2382 length:930 start_codon:yes stop_codon:yes gene_type:complete